MEEGYSQEVMRTTATLGRKEAWDHAKARMGIARMEHRVRPGLYALGEPTRSSPVLVTANYSLSFDALRSSLPGRDAWVLVLDTGGINVWCAAGKGTFGTEELVRAIEATKLSERVDGRTLILPQLGAPGVSAQEVHGATGFKVEYGPVRAEDLPFYLDRGECTDAMRTVRFDLRDRLVLAPVELRNHRWGLALLVLLAVLVPFYGLEALVVALGGLLLFPALLPYLPGKDLSLRGMALGALLVTPFALFQLASGMDAATLLAVPAEFLLMVPLAGYLGLNFTGSTPFTSRTGVRREIFTYIPKMAAMAVLGTVIGGVALLVHWGWL
ncbi:MAG TPA: mercury methylation corrinoid protein HgcA [Methanomassiliicoccales archaeon]|nr:mercury methylation corrinoid protein HgcA [Methanomassiliicoccales archaeon]HRR66928.1 mercury methylation corrinoid protein HgcA [Methanomassiliicoccales archaeon]